MNNNFVKKSTLTSVTKSMTPGFTRSRLSIALKAALLAPALMVGTSYAQSDLPVEYTNDSRFNIESISTNNNDMTVTQNGQVAWVKWDTYNVGADNSVTYNYTEGGNNFHALNFILGSEISQIQGNISSDGNVYIYNSNGIVFSNTAVINVAGLLASTQSPSSESIDSIATQLADGAAAIDLEVVLSGDDGAGAIQINDAASITSTINDITLIAETISAADTNGDSVSDTVTLNSQGSINLFANNRSTVTIDTTTDVFSVEVTESLEADPESSLIDMQNSEMIAQVGVNISALSAQALTMNAINTTGIVQADSVTIDADGSVVLGDITTETLTANVSAGDVTDEGVVDAGYATFTMSDSTEANITLDSANNDIFAFSAFGDNINDITLVDNFGMVLNGIEADVFTLTTTGDVLQSDRFVIGDAFITAALNDSRFNIYLDWVPDDGVSFNEVDHFGAVGHNVYLIDAGGVNLTGISAQRDLIVSTDGAITQTGSLDVLNNAYVYAVDADNVGYNITLEHDFNNFGTLHLAGNEVSIVDGDSLVLGDVEVATSLLATVLSGDITDTGTITAPFATFNALDNTEANIFLDSLNNRIDVFAAIGDNINEINLVDNGGIILDGVTARMFTLDTTGEVSQSDVLNIDDAFISAADGTTTYNIDLSLVLDDDSTFNQIGAFGGIGNNISIIDGEGILLTGVTATGDLLILTDGDITQELSAFGALDIAGNTMLSALNNNGTGFNIVLDNANNNLGTFHGVGAEIQIVDGFDLELGNIDVANTLSAISLTGNITDSGVILAPDARFYADAGDITLDSLSNQFGVFSASGDTVSVFHEYGLVLGDINVENLIATVESGDVADSGVVNAGSVTFNMGDSTAANITLDSANNDIFSFSAFGDNINDITLVDNFGMVLNGIEADVFTLTTTGDVLQSDRFVIGDAFITAALNDSRFNIYLDWVPDDGVSFNEVDHFGAVGHNVYLIDAGGVNLTGISAQRDLIVSTDGAITQTGSLDVLNNAWVYAVDADNVGYNITLEHDFNNFGTLHLAGNEVSIVDRDSLVLGDVEVATSLLATVLSGDITDTGTITAPFATFNALDNTEANIFLDSLNNRIDVFAAIGDNINEINLVDNGGIILDGVTARMFTLDTTGEVSQSDVLNIDDAFISAADGTTTYNIDLSLVLDDNTTFNQIGAFGGIGNNISIIDGEGILLTGVTATGDLLILTDGDITQNFALDIAGNTMLSALNNNGTGFNIVLDNANNNLGTFHASAADIVLVDNQGLALGNVDANSLVLTSNGDVSQVADSAVTLDTLDISVGDGDSISLDGTQNTANAVTIASAGNVLVEELNFVANDENTDSINIDAEGSVMLNRIVAESADITVTANNHALTMFTNDEAQIVGNNVSVKVGGVIGLNSVTAANNIELIAFGAGTEQAPLTLTVVNPVEAGGVVGAAISEQGSVELASTLDNLQFYTVSGDYSADVTLGLEEGSNPSPGVTAGLPQPEPEPEPEPEPDTSAEEALAKELFATGQRSLTIPAKRPVPVESAVGFEVPANAVKLPSESDAVR